MLKRHGARIRDPIHGSLEFDADELALVDHRAYQRLRLIKQLGLADLAFPGATHTRFAHGLGVTHVAARMFDGVTRDYELTASERQRLRTTLRLAALFHDLGHAPLSHTTERFMPPVRQLELGPWMSGSRDRRAGHEDYTLKILVDSDLTELFRRRFRDRGVEPEDVCALLANRLPEGMANPFHIGGRNWLPLLHQCVSSEVDADRMDYLLRDSYFAGVPYGRYDSDWLIENLTTVERGVDLHLGLHAKASFGFEDYLLSRYHMFMSVYFHHVPIGYELMLTRFFAESAHELRFPANIEQYFDCDDMFLQIRLKRSDNPWARRIIERRGYRMLAEEKGLSQDGTDAELGGDLELLHLRLEEAQVPAILHTVQGRLSKYFSFGASRPPGASEPDLYFVEDNGRTFTIDNYSPLYRRYAGAAVLKRVYVDPDASDRAQRVLNLTLGGKRQR